MTLFDRMDGAREVPGPRWTEATSDGRPQPAGLGGARFGTRSACWLLAAGLHLAIVAMVLLAPPPAKETPVPDSISVDMVAMPAPPLPVRDELVPLKDIEPPAPVQRTVIRPVAKPVAIAEMAFPVPAAPASSQPAPPPATQPAPAPAAAKPPETYLSALYAHLEQYKRYPRALRAARVQGTVLLRFTMDHAGRVLARDIVQASGHTALDEEAESMIDRAQPLPKPPPDMPNPVDMTIPVQFAVR